MWNTLKIINYFKFFNETNKLNETNLQISLGYSGVSLNPAVFPGTPEHA